MASSSATFSVIGPDVSIKGDVSANADLHIDGTVEGDISCTSLVQGESSEVRGGIEAETARLAGSVKGSINVRELIVLKTARITGDVHYDALTVEQGARVDGQFAHRGAAEAARRAAQPAPPQQTASPRPDSSKPDAPKVEGSGGSKPGGDEPKLTLAG
ncbi:MAG TPA: polymer-forming cytoskeletal protein [Alteraurantiacibacter sp.]|jgi:cytoskeletal protein CcmA (bactofilin family)